MEHGLGSGKFGTSLKSQRSHTTVKRGYVCADPSPRGSPETCHSDVRVVWIASKLVWLSKPENRQGAWPLHWYLHCKCIGGVDVTRSEIRDHRRRRTCNVTIGYEPGMVRVDIGGSGLVDMRAPKGCFTDMNMYCIHGGMLVILCI